MKDVIEHKFKFHEDDRGQRFQDVYGDNMSESQINVTFINSTKHIVAWHKHNIQTDYWTVLKGLLKVGEFEYLSDKNPRVLQIKPGVYHGYKALEPGTILCYYLTEKYNPDDEIRANIGDFGEDWTTPNK